MTDASSTSSGARTTACADPHRIPFTRRHIGPDQGEIDAMLETLGYPSLGQLVDAAVPSNIRMTRELEIHGDRAGGMSEAECLDRLREIGERNVPRRSMIGTGYHDCHTPPPIQRHILENPGWYTAYTPYQAEIAQGRLEALLTFQTMICDLTGLAISNASLLDEATAAAEAMALCRAATRTKEGGTFQVSADCHPQTIEVVQTRAAAVGVEIVVAPTSDLDPGSSFGLLLQYPTTDGRIVDFRDLVRQANDNGAMVVMAADPLALLLLESPGELGADVAVGSTQRFGMPMGFGGPHAAYIATHEEHRRLLPGRVVGVSKDRRGRPAYRLALQTREQHIRRDRATSNICTAQVLPAVVASTYAVYHGREGLTAIAHGVHQNAVRLHAGLVTLGLGDGNGEPFFDTCRAEAGSPERRDQLFAAAADAGYDLRKLGACDLAMAVDETTTAADVDALLASFASVVGEHDPTATGTATTSAGVSPIPESLRRSDEILTAEVFRQHRTETELMRYLHRLESKDLSLTTSMIPLGSCTMKLNAAAEMMPVTWPAFASPHPFAPAATTQGYGELLEELERWLAEITGFAAISLQPNAGSQGEFAGLLTIKQYLVSTGQGHRDICLIPTSAHGTNPASAVLAGMRVVAVDCDDEGNIDLEHLTQQLDEHGGQLAAIMITYPSTHGVFEDTVSTVCELVHEHGGQVYLDGANLNAQVGLARPGDYGADVCHLNLHKTFCIPHGGGGPGMGPIGVREHLAPYLPGHSVTALGGSESLGAIAAAPFGSGCILPISWAYIAMMGAAGLREASEVAILNANYIAKRLEGEYQVLYRGPDGLVAHECILDLRPLKEAGIEVDDVAKRLIDYGFHAPTVSWPVAGTIMIEPTESESQSELDRFCDAMLLIRAEARAVEIGKVAVEDSPLRHAPHTAEDLLVDDWQRPYPRSQGAFPAPWTREHKYWPPVSRIDNAWGDRNLMCTCAGVEELAMAADRTD